MEQVVSLVERGWAKIILTHGNGPQVGQIFLQQELTKNEFPRQVTLDICVADSQGRIGYILQNVFDTICQKRGIQKRAFAVITQVVVDPNDPAFDRPTKPIGLFYNLDDAEILKKERGWRLIEDAGRGYRRVVPSPRPLQVVEKEIFEHLVNQGFIAIGAGGGGIPVVRNPEGGLWGVEAVIDKDRTAALLAEEIGLEELILLTDVDHVYFDYKSSNPKPLKNVTAREMATYLKEGHFAEGSMRPKVEAALEFLRGKGKRAVIAHLEDLMPALEGKRGTQILPD